ncbi:Interleukin 25 [Mactra antiquata]
MKVNIPLLMTCCLVICIVGMDAKNKRRRRRSKLCKVNSHSIADIRNQITCPDNRTKEMQHPIKVESLCPYYYKVDYDPNRYPAYLEGAIPLSQYCLGTNNQFECVPVTKDIRVLQKSECKDQFDNDVWSEATVRQVLGFICAKRTVVPVKTREKVMDYM